MSSQRDAFGSLKPLSYVADYDRCGVGRSACGGRFSGCGAPAVAWFRDNGAFGTTPRPAVFGVCAEHVEHYRHEYIECPRPEGDGPVITVY